MQKQVNVNLNFFTWQTCFNTHLNFHTYEKTTNKCTLKFLYLDANIFNMYTLKFPHLCSPFKGGVLWRQNFLLIFFARVGWNLQQTHYSVFLQHNSFSFQISERKKENKQDFFTNLILHVPARLLISSLKKNKSLKNKNYRRKIVKK